MDWKPPLDRLESYLGKATCATTKVFKTNDWDQPEIQYSTGASNQVRNVNAVPLSI